MKSAKAPRKLKVLPGGRDGVVSPGVVVNRQGYFEMLFENASDALLVVDIKTAVISSANQSTLELTGFLRDELVGEPVSTLFPVAGHVPQHSHGLNMDHVTNSGFFEDLVLKGKDGLPRFVSASVKAIELEGKPVAMCIMRDVAEKKNMERDLITKHTELRNAYVSLEKANAELKAMQETLVQSGKLAALGELAAGIAHELNQPLTAVRGFAQEARAVVAERKDETLVSFMDEVVRGAQKMERIISHLRNFTRKSTEDFTIVDVHSVIDESLLLLDKQLRSRGIRVEKHYGKGLPQLYCNPFQLEQVFINLATNARDAIEAKRAGHGVILITTTKSASGDFIEIKYEDDGCGIAESSKGKIFNPFFTTKEVGKGMGLGLSISYGILSRINASILVESAMGKGTTFTIKLPVDYRKH